MNRRPPALRRTGAFTLIELLLAVAVFAIVLLAINTVYFAALRLRNKQSEAFDVALPLQHTTAVMQRDLEGLLFPGTGMIGQFQSTPTATSNAPLMELNGQRVSPDIYTTTGLVDDSSPFGDVQRVAYFLALPTNNAPGRDLMRAVSRNLLPAGSDVPEQQVLLGGVQTVEFEFFNGTAWVQTWDSASSSNLPSAIRVQIAMAAINNRGASPEPVQLIVPVVVQGQTNQVAQTTGGGQ